MEERRIIRSSTMHAAVRRPAPGYVLAVALRELLAPGYFLCPAAAFGGSMDGMSEGENQGRNTASARATGAAWS